MAELVDKWHAECLPCKWLELYDEQQDAIDAVEEHVHALHWKVPPEERGRLYMGHVQCRTVGAVQHPKDAPREDNPVNVASFPGDGAANIESARAAAGTAPDVPVTGKE